MDKEDKRDEKKAIQFKDLILNQVKILNILQGLVSAIHTLNEEAKKRHVAGKF